MHVVALGFGLGFVVAAAIGPISLLCIRTVLRGALGTGVAIGAGAAVVDAAYALLGALGAGRLLAIGPLQVVLGLGAVAGGPGARRRGGDRLARAAHAVVGVPRSARRRERRGGGLARARVPDVAG